MTMYEIYNLDTDEPITGKYGIEGPYGSITTAVSKATIAIRNWKPKVRLAVRELEVHHTGKVFPLDKS